VPGLITGGGLILNTDERLAILESEVAHLKTRDQQLNGSIQKVEAMVWRMCLGLFAVMGGVIATFIAVVWEK